MIRFEEMEGHGGTVGGVECSTNIKADNEKKYTHKLFFYNIY
jgi:hypothetical protein